MHDPISTLATAASLRYRGDDTDEMPVNDIIASLLAHRSVRKYRPGPVSEMHLSALVAAAQSASTASNLRSWSLIAVRDPERKATLARLADSQEFINNAPLFLVWVADLGRSHRLTERSDGTADELTDLDSRLVAVIDTSLAAENAAVAAESLGLGVVFVGALRNHPDAVARELRLPADTFAVFGLAVGWPDPTENASVRPKLPQAAVLHHGHYNAPYAEPHASAHDTRLEPHTTAHGMVDSWTDRLLRPFAGVESLSGDRIRATLRHLGFPWR